MSEDANGDRYVSWKTLLMWAVPSAVSMCFMLVGVSLWLVSSHSEGTHKDAVAYREFIQLQQSINELRKEVQVLRQEVRQAVR